ncbi:MAG: hypothetical protein GY874_22215 [Desulfobacteraceae bacterium]|nr:hypothetical protein [Desulfobacteraceae bacterium]
MINVFDVSFDIDKKYADTIKKQNQTFGVKKSDKLKFIIYSNEERMMGCNDVVQELEKDFCTAFSSTKEYYEKLFLLTPQNLSDKKYIAAGNRWIVHNKGSMFQDVNKILVYELNDFTVFRRDMKPSKEKNLAVELIMFSDKNPNKYLTMGFREKNEPLISQILKTIR